MDEKTMKIYASYAIGLFVGHLLKDKCSSAEIAHALFLLTEDAYARRRELLLAQEKENDNG